MDSGPGKMLPLQILASAAPTVAHSVRRWIYHLGGLGFIPLGVLDSSVVPLPGSMDVLTIFLSARNKELWFYYALMATTGSLIGGYVTFRLARKGGKEMLARRFSPQRLEKVYNTFERWGLGAIAVPALLPPPVPMFPFLLAAGALQYPVRKFLFALSLGRMARYMLLAFLAARYGRHIIRHPGVLVAVGLIVTVAMVLFVLFEGRRPKLPRAV